MILALCLQEFFGLSSISIFSRDCLDCGEIVPLICKERTSHTWQVVVHSVVPGCQHDRGNSTRIPSLHKQEGASWNSSTVGTPTSREFLGRRKHMGFRRIFCYLLFLKDLGIPMPGCKTWRLPMEIAHRDSHCNCGRDALSDSSCSLLAWRQLPSFRQHILATEPGGTLPCVMTYLQREGVALPYLHIQIEITGKMPSTASQLLF